VHTARAALMIDRAVTAVLCLGLLGIAAWVLVGGSPVVLVGLAAAVSPSALVLGASASTSGPEVVGAAAFTAIAISLARGTWRTAWIAFAFAGVVLASSRPLGPLWVATGFVVLVWFTGGPRPAWRRFREGGGAAVAAALAIGVAVGASVWWELAMQPSRDWRVSDLFDWSPGLKSVPRVLRESVGVFGPVNGTHLLPLGYIGWAVVVGLLVALALRYGRP